MSSSLSSSLTVGNPVSYTHLARPWNIEDGALFAWVPTLTSVSRQAIFAGEPPFFFAASLDSTHKEEAHWLRFWEARGLRRNELAYLRQQQAEGDDGLTERVAARISDPKCRVLSVIVSTVDQMIHCLLYTSRCV